MRRWEMRMLSLLSVGVAVLTALVIVGYSQLIETGIQASDAAHQAQAFSAQTRGLAQTTHRLVLAIQAQRIEFIISGCQQQNRRHRRTVHELDVILRRAERAAPPIRRAQLRESRASTLLLIDALAPYQDCKALVGRVTVH